MKQLDTVEEEKDLGITITKDLKVSQQCKQAYTKASRLYKSLVKPYMEIGILYRHFIM